MEEAEIMGCVIHCGFGYVCETPDAAHLEHRPLGVKTVIAKTMYVEVT